MKKAGIDIDKIAANLGDAAVFVEGRTRATLGGALVIEAKNADRGPEHGVQRRHPAALPTGRPA